MLRLYCEALLGIALLSTPAAAQQRPEVARRRVERLPDSLVRRLLGPHLARDERLELPGFAGPFGPGLRTVLALTKTGVDTAGFRIGENSAFRGLALVDSGGSRRVFRLPVLSDQPWIASQIVAVLFEDVDADSVLEVVVIATYITGFGRQGAVPFFSNAVLDWVGGEYIHRPDIERDIENLETAAAVRRVLRARRR